MSALVSTPRTDSRLHKRELRDLSSFSVVEEVPADFARELEREVYALRAELAQFLSCGDCDACASGLHGYCVMINWDRFKQPKP